MVSRSPEDIENDLSAIDDIEAEFDFDAHKLAAEVRRLQQEVAKLQDDLDEAVGYKLATAEETRGDQDRDV